MKNLSFVFFEHILCQKKLWSLILETKKKKSKLPIFKQFRLFMFLSLRKKKSKSTFVFCNTRLYYILCVLCFIAMFNFVFFSFLLCLSVPLSHPYILYSNLLCCVCDFATMTCVCIFCSSQFYWILTKKKKGIWVRKFWIDLLNRIKLKQDNMLMNAIWW